MKGSLMKPLSGFRSAAGRGIIWLLVYAVTFLPVCGGIGASRRAMAASEHEMVQEGINYYKHKELEKALQTFESAEVIYPDNLAIPYYLGLIFLAKGDRPAAIEQWKRYIAMAPKDESTLAIRKNITLLLRKEAQEYARKAVADEETLLQGAVDENTVAVTSYKNLGSAQLGPLGKGLAAMIIVDLSQFHNLQVIEREKLQALLAEMKLGTSGLVDEKSAPKVGKLLRAKYVTGGSLADLEKKRLQIASILLDASLNTTLSSQDTIGYMKNFYELEKEIACRIAADLGRDCTQAPKGFEKIHTKSLPALAAYSQGLDYLDQDKYDEARVMFQKAVEEDPEFDLAQAALLATPAAAMLLISESQMISSASASAPSASASAVSASAASASAGAGASTAAASSAGGGISLGTTAAIAGGAVLVGGAAAGVAALMDETPQDNDNGGSGIGGGWKGTWSDAAGNTGDFFLNLTQDGSSLGGEVQLTGSDCFSGGQITGGSLDGSRIVLDISSSEASANLSAQVNLTSGSMDGNLDITSGSCSGTTLSISTSRTGSADVNW